jgi:hypothetical protein
MVRRHERDRQEPPAVRRVGRANAELVGRAMQRFPGAASLCAMVVVRLSRSAGLDSPHGGRPVAGLVTSAAARARKSRFACAGCRSMTGLSIASDQLDRLRQVLALAGRRPPGQQAPCDTAVTFASMRQGCGVRSSVSARGMPRGPCTGGLRSDPDVPERSGGAVPLLRSMTVGRQFVFSARRRSACVAAAGYRLEPPLGSASSGKSWSSLADVGPSSWGVELGCSSSLVAASALLASSAQVRVRGDDFRAYPLML